MIETRLLDQAAYGTVFARGYRTVEVPIKTGVVRRGVTRQNSLRRFVVKFHRLLPADHATVIAAFEVCDGAATAFRLRDPSDYTGTNEALGNTPGANQTPMQLIKTYSFGGTDKTRKITKPITGAVIEQADGAGGWAVKAGTLATTTGLFTPDTNWTAGRAVRATFEFDVPVRFASDDLAFAYDEYAALTADVELVEDLDQVLNPS